MLFALGSNGSGQLGLAHDEDVATPHQVSASSFNQELALGIKRLAAGGNHTIVLSKRGCAFGSGDTSDGRCAAEGSDGFGSFHKIIDPMDDDSQWTDVAATWEATVLARNDGREIWVCGTGGSGELGLGNGVREARQLTQIHDFPPAGKQVSQLAACMAHVIVVLDDGEVWGWGKGRKGQLGEVAEDAWTPRRVDGIDFNIERAVCGKDFTCVFGSSQTGEIAMLGPNGRDRFGLKIHAPAKIAGWKEVSASWGNVFVLEETGKFVAWGRDDHGQLPPHGLPPIANIAAGSEHCLALTLDGKVLAWGWGEHGNCGEHTDAKGDVKARWNELEVSERAVDVFGGCATSFILTA